MVRRRASGRRQPSAGIPLAPAPAQLRKKGAPSLRLSREEEVSSLRGDLPTGTGQEQQPLPETPGSRLRSHLRSPAGSSHPANRSAPFRCTSSPQPWQAKTGPAWARQTPLRQAATDPPARRSLRARRAAPGPHRGQRNGPAPGAGETPPSHNRSPYGAPPRTTAPQAPGPGPAHADWPGPSPGARRASSQGAQSGTVHVPADARRTVRSGGQFSVRLPDHPIPIDGAGPAHRARDDGDGTTKREVRRLHGEAGPPAP